MSCSDWTEYIIDDIADVKSGKRLPKGHMLSEEITPFPYIRLVDISNCKVSKNNFKYLEKETQEKIKKYIVNKNDICLAIVGHTIGVVFYIDEEFDGINLTENAVRITNLKPFVHNKFIFYSLISPKGQHDIAIRKIGSAQWKLPIYNVKALPITLPTLPEQEKIASILSSLDDKIELNNQMNETLEEIAQTLFKRWFVDFEFPNEEGKPYKSSGGEMVPSELGEIPKDWEVDRADKFYTIRIGKTPPRKEKEWFSFNCKDFPWLSIKDLGESGVYCLNTSEYLTDEAVERFNVNIAPKNTVVLSFKLTVGRVAITNKDMVTNEAIAHFNTNSNLTSEYTYLYLKQFNYESLGSTSSIATATNSKVIKSMPFIKPNDEVIKTFCENTASLFETIRNNQLEIENLTKTRDLILPKLMSGEIRV